MTDITQPGRTEDLITYPRLDPRRLRQSLGRFATGVTVVTYAADHEPRGFTVNSFTSVSMDPPLVLVSVARSARAADGLKQTSFVVNVLSREQLPLAKQFAGQHQDGLYIPWSHHHAIPRLRGSVAWFECRPYSQVSAGDHILVLGRIVDHRTSLAEPLLFQAGQFGSLAGQASTEASSARQNLSRWATGHAANLAEEGCPAVISH